MKTFIIKLLLTLTVIVYTTLSFSFAQSKEPYEMVVDGVKVIVQPSGNEIVVIQTVLKGGVQNYPADKAGIESLAINALTECGTTNDDKNSFKNKLDKVNAQVYGYSGMDYASFVMNCIKSDFDVVWPLYADALTKPLFDEKEFTRIKQDAINILKARSSDPDYAIQKLARETAFAGKNYAKAPEGMEAIVTKLTAAETKDYYHSLLTKSRMVIVVVGEMDSSVLKDKIHAMLAAVPQGKPFTLVKATYTPKQNTFIAQKKDLATNYIQGVTGGPMPGTKEYNAFLLAMRIFYDRHFLEVRTNNGLSYAPISYFDGGLTPNANIVVSTTDPDKYIGVLTKLIDKTKKQGFTAEEVKNMKTTYITGFYYKLETNDAQASSLAQNEVVHNNWRRSMTLNDDLKKVTPEDVNKAFNKYITNLTWVYQGDPTKVDAKLFTQTVKQPTAKEPKIILKHEVN
jgi:zinc protease